MKFKICLCITLINICTKVSFAQILKPVLLGEGYKIFGEPKIKAREGKLVDVVDHTIYKRQDGKWTVLAALRNSIPNHPLYKWECDQIMGKKWNDIGIAYTAEHAYDEDTVKGLYAPHMIQVDGWYYLYYTSNGGLHVMRSKDGNQFERIRDKRGSYDLVGKLIGRDVMIFKDDDQKYYAFSCLSTFDKNNWHQSQVIVTFGKWQNDPLDWSWPEYAVVNQGGQGGNGHVSSESPFVVKIKDYYYLFRASSMTFKTYVYASKSLFDFGTNTDDKLVAVLPLKAAELVQDNGQWYITDLDDFRGLKIWKLKWEPLSK